jgi:hypothetical protein
MICTVAHYDIARPLLLLRSHYARGSEGHNAPRQWSYVYGHGRVHYVPFAVVGWMYDAETDVDGGGPTTTYKYSPTPLQSLRDTEAAPTIILL